MKNLEVKIFTSELSMTFKVYEHRSIKICLQRYFLKVYSQWKMKTNI